MSDTEWGTYYENVSLKDYVLNIANHLEMFSEILKEELDSTIEVGTGSGTMSIFLSRQVEKAVGVENNLEILERARQNQERFGGDSDFKMMDAFNLEGEYDVAFSQGLLEHFSDSEIRYIVGEKLEVADKAVISVPSYFYGVQDFGD